MPAQPWRPLQIEDIPRKMRWKCSRQAGESTRNWRKLCTVCVIKLNTSARRNLGGMIGGKLIVAGTAAERWITLTSLSRRQPDSAASAVEVVSAVVRCRCVDGNA